MEKTTRILVADDNETFLEMLIKELVFQGHEVSSARDGEEAVEMLEKGTYDLVLLDIDMPRRNGLEVLRFIKDQGLPTKVVMLTGYGNYGNVLAARRLDADDFVEKPCDILRLLAVIDRLLPQ